MMANSAAAQPGDRWLVSLQPIDAVTQGSREATVKLIDFDPRTQTWSVEEEGGDGSTTALLAKHLIKRL
jgi:hypothetical protein